MRVLIDVRAEDVIDAFLESADNDEALEFIKQIDAGMQDYGFTEQLAKHFVLELQKEAAAGGEPFDINQLLRSK